VDLSTITVADFKAHFRRDFPYLNEYDNAALYNSGSRVYYASTELFYDCLLNGTTGIEPAEGANWTVVADDIYNYILDEDIEKAFQEAQIVFNQSLFGTDAQITLGYLYLAANYLVNDIRASQSGLSGKGAFSVTSRSVGNVSESYGIPEAYLNNPVYQFYTQSPYGLKYLSLVLPQLVGNVGAVFGATRP
jgi:hypothetical protein